MRMALVVAVGVALLLAFVNPLGADSIDPGSLIGAWSGKWVRQGGRPQRGVMTEGPYTLTITKVEGQSVDAHVYSVTGQGTVERDVKAKLEGDRLTFGETRFTVTAGHMRGARTGGAFPVEINLTKTK